MPKIPSMPQPQKLLNDVNIEAVKYTALAQKGE